MATPSRARYTGDMSTTALNPRIHDFIEKAGSKGASLPEIVAAVFPEPNGEAEAHRFKQRAYYVITKGMADVRGVGAASQRRYVLRGKRQPEIADIPDNTKPRRGRPPGSGNGNNNHTTAVAKTSIAAYIIHDIRQKLDELERVL